MHFPEERDSPRGFCPAPIMRAGRTPKHHVDAARTTVASRSGRKAPERSSVMLRDHSGSVEIVHATPLLFPAWKLFFQVHTYEARPARLYYSGGERSSQAMRILFYSPDSYGLGHVSRTLAIASRLIRDFPAATALVLTGAPRAHYFS